MCARVAANLADGQGKREQEQEEEAELRKGNGASGVYVEPENVAKDNGGGNRWGRRNERESAEGGGGRVGHGGNNNIDTGNLRKLHTCSSVSNEIFMGLWGKNSSGGVNFTEIFTASNVISFLRGPPLLHDQLYPSLSVT